HHDREVGQRVDVIGGCPLVGGGGPVVEVDADPAVPGDVEAGEGVLVAPFVQPDGRTSGRLGATAVVGANLRERVGACPSGELDRRFGVGDRNVVNDAA